MCGKFQNWSPPGKHQEGHLYKAGCWLLKVKLCHSSCTWPGYHVVLSNLLEEQPTRPLRAWHLEFYFEWLWSCSPQNILSGLGWLLRPHLSLVPSRPARSPQSSPHHNSWASPGVHMLPARLEGERTNPKEGSVTCTAAEILLLFWWLLLSLGGHLIFKIKAQNTECNRSLTVCQGVFLRQENTSLPHKCEFWGKMPQIHGRVSGKAWSVLKIDNWTQILVFSRATWKKKMKSHIFLISKTPLWWNF